MSNDPKLRNKNTFQEGGMPVQEFVLTVVKPETGDKLAPRLGRPQRVNPETPINPQTTDGQAPTEAV